MLCDLPHDIYIKEYIKIKFFNEYCTVNDRLMYIFMNLHALRNEFQFNAV